MQPDKVQDFVNNLPEPRNDVKDILATNIARYRTRLRISRAELAKRIGVTEAAIGQYERGTRSPQIEIVCKLANALNVPIDKLVEQGISDYNAVSEYRFDRATNFLQMFDIFVFEDDVGKIVIRSRKENEGQKFYSENGIIVAEGNQEKLNTLAIFNDRETFLLWLEQLIDFSLYGGDMQMMLKAAMYCLMNDKKFEPNTKFRYFGNAADEF